MKTAEWATFGLMRRNILRKAQGFDQSQARKETCAVIARITNRGWRCRSLQV
jgi:hypothetical protein